MMQSVTILFLSAVTLTMVQSKAFNNYPGINYFEDAKEDAFNDRENNDPFFPGYTGEFPNEPANNLDLIKRICNWVCAEFDKVKCDRKCEYKKI